MITGMMVSKLANGGGSGGGMPLPPVDSAVYFAKNGVWSPASGFFPGSDKILTWSDSVGLISTLGIKYDTTSGRLNLVGKSGAVIDFVDLGLDRFLKDARVEIDPEGQNPGTYIVLVMSTESGAEDTLYVNVNEIMVIDPDAPFEMGSKGLALKTGYEGYTTAEKSKLATLMPADAATVRAYSDNVKYITPKSLLYYMQYEFVATTDDTTNFYQPAYFGRRHYSGGNSPAGSPFEGFQTFFVIEPTEYNNQSIVKVTATLLNNNHPSYLPGTTAINIYGAPGSEGWSGWAYNVTSDLNSIGSAKKTPIPRIFGDEVQRAWKSAANFWIDPVNGVHTSFDNPDVGLTEDDAFKTYNAAYQTAVRKHNFNGYTVTFNFAPNSTINETITVQGQRFKSPGTQIMFKGNGTTINPGVNGICFDIRNFAISTGYCCILQDFNYINYGNAIYTSSACWQFAGNHNFLAQSNTNQYVIAVAGGSYLLNTTGATISVTLGSTAYEFLRIVDQKSKVNWSVGSLNFNNTSTTFTRPWVYMNEGYFYIRSTFQITGVDNIVASKMYDIYRGSILDKGSVVLPGVNAGSNDVSSYVL